MNCEKCKEYRDEAIRCRALAKAMMEGAHEDGVMMEITQSPTAKNGFALFICAPSLDEKKFLEMAGEVLKMLNDNLGTGATYTREPKISGTGTDQ